MTTIAPNAQIGTDSSHPFHAPSPTVWIAYYDDWSGIAIFGSEVDALRHACEEHMRVAMIVMPCKDIKAEAAKHRVKESA